MSVSLRKDEERYRRRFVARSENDDDEGRVMAWKVEEEGGSWVVGCGRARSGAVEMGQRD